VPLRPPLPEPKRCPLQAFLQAWEGLKMCNAPDAPCVSWQKVVYPWVCMGVSVCP